ncbi:MAG: helix-hairpin-helix domain-containing protein [Thermodesulfobacteriota bacterium]
MKCPDRETVSQLEELPNIGKAMAADLRLLKIFHPGELIGRDPYRLYDELCSLTGEKHDPCVIDVFLSVVSFMEGGKAAPWWEYTAERKRRMAVYSSSSSNSSIPINSS